MNTLCKPFIPSFAAFFSVLCALATAGFQTNAQAEAAKVADKPNILILYADDLGYGDLSSYNPKSKIPTPNLDRLASEGMRFTDGHSSSGICTPSRYAMLTGRYHWRRFHGIVVPWGNSVFKPKDLTLPEMLQAEGYTTAAIGKWHLGWNWNAVVKPDAKPVVHRNSNGGRRKTWGPEAIDWSKPIPNGPLDHGFDYYFGDAVINFPPYAWIENDKVVDAPDRMMDTRLWKPVKEFKWRSVPGPMVTGWDPYENIPTTVEKGVEKIHEYADSGDPFFLYFAFPSPHVPVIPNDEFDGSSGAGPYGDFVVETDAACGTLLAALEDAGVADNTIVIFSADNGAEHLAFARDEKFDHWSSEPLRGIKRDIYEGGHRVPFIVKWPGVTPEGRVSDALISQVDLMATFAAGLGVDLPEVNVAEDSFNQLPVLSGKTAAVRDAHVHNTNKNRYAIRQGDWLLIDWKTGNMHSRLGHKDWEARHGYENDDLPHELYNIREDIAQRTNLAAKHPKKVAELKALLAQIRKQGFSAP